MFSFLKKFGKQGRRKGVLKRTLIWDPESSGSNPSLTACRAIGQVSQLGIPHRQVPTHLIGSLRVSPFLIKRHGRIRKKQNLQTQK